jgi:biopolymer transport protein ExbB
MIHPLQRTITALLAAILTFLPLVGSAAGGTEEAWWDKAWTGRKSLDVKPSAAGRPTGAVPVLVRLHEGNFPFAALKEDGSDLRVLADDHKTELPFHLERYDSLMNEAFLWLRLPEIKEGPDPTKVWLYFGNAAAENAGDPKATYPDPAALVYHFAERGAPPRDSSSKENNGTVAPTPTEGALIGAGIILFGTNGMEIPAGDSLKWEAGAQVTVMTWVKPSALSNDAVVYRRAEGASSFVLGVDDGVPYVEVKDAAGTARTNAGEPVGTATWHHLAAVAGAGKIDLFVNGKAYGSVAKGMPALAGTAYLGTTPEAGGGFAGEIDELEIYNAPLDAPLLAFIAAEQSGTDESQALVAIGADEGGGGGGHNETLEHLMLFGDIANNMMFDGWVAIGVCVIMMIVGGFVAVKKFLYLNSIQKGTEAFMKQWAHISSDLTALDHLDEQSVKSMGGKISPRLLKHIKRSPLYHLYHIGCQEIGYRIKDKENHSGLSGRSMQAIRTSLDSGLVRENHRMNGGLIFLTISIAGGPYVGLLGTVVGVMITFAIISKTGEVEVASIAPGIASALLATVFGLLVAIPALFIYSYLSSRIKDLIASMQIFIDEFIAKMAEIYPPAADSEAAPDKAPKAPSSQSAPKSPSPTATKPKADPQPALTANLDSHAS